MDTHSIPANPDNSRSPGQRPHWCRNSAPEDTGTNNATGAAVFSWSRSFGGTIGAELSAEDHLTPEGGQAFSPRIYAYGRERGGMSLGEAEQLALAIIDAVKAAREDGQR